MTAAILGEYRNGVSVINEEYLKRVRYCGVETIVPEFGDVGAAAKCDSLVVCGGGDCDPAFFGQKPYRQGEQYNRDFDIFEIETIKQFIKAKKPVLGICRGMQMINVACGGTLCQNIPSLLGIDHPPRHRIKVCKRAKLYSAIGAASEVNSFHHQCVDKAGAGLRIAALAEDGIIEAVEGIKAPILGVQWHPERMDGNAVFECFFQNQ